jgi:hypothetical protein
MRKALAPPGRSTSKQGNQPAKDVVRSPTALRNPASRRESAAPQGTALPQSFAVIPKLASQEVTTEENPQRTPSLPLQRKLAIGAVNDPLEAEADAIADRVVGGSLASAPHFGAVAVRRKCACEGSGKPCAECEEEKNKVQRKATAAITPTDAPPVVHDVLSSPGQPLDSATRSLMEPRFGRDFGRVRIHTGDQAARSARTMNALAYTVGPDVVFDSNRYVPATQEGQKLLAHELAHVAQQGNSDSSVVRRATGSASSGTGAPSPPAPNASATGGSARPAASPIAVDVISAENPEDFLARAAAQNLGVDIRVRSMVDMVDQVERLTSGKSCLSRLSIFNHANPSYQRVSGGREKKSQPAPHEEGFSLSWLLSDASHATLNRLRHSLCCNAEVNWYGCSTAGVWAGGDERSAAEVRQSSERYSGTFGHFYHDVSEAAAHGATSFQFIGPVNVQSWANALCTTVNAATDFNNWRTTGSGVVRTVIHGGQMVPDPHEANINCSCDATSGRLAADAPTTTQLSQRATELRERALKPIYEQTRSAIGSNVAPTAETPAQRSERESFERDQAKFFAEVGENIRNTILEHAGFTPGAQPRTADDALKVTALWGLDVDKIVANLGTLSTSVSGRTTTATTASLDQQQENLEGALTPKGRESFMNALLAVRREHFWNQHLQNHRIYIFPDLSGVNRYRGYTQHSSQPSATGPAEEVWVIHISKDLLESGDQGRDLATASIVHELSHTLGGNVLEPAMQLFERQLADLLVDHPRIAALRNSATDAAAARLEHLRLLRQMIHDATTYAEGEVFVHLQQLTHQPAMTVNGKTISGSDFILDEVTFWIGRLACIGLQPRLLVGLLGSIRRRVDRTYDDRIAAAPAGSPERQRLVLDKQIADAMWPLALSQAQSQPCKP